MIISILGTAGKDKDTQKAITAYYDAEVLNKKSGNYYNSTHFLLENYNDNFFFIGTKKAIEYQKDILDFNKDNIKLIPIDDNSLDNIFEEVYKLISQVKDNEKVLLDITHGFRHQPISAIFSATLHKFLNNSNLDILFAKQIVAFKEYEYIYLTNYVEITQLSLLLTGFIRTLNFVNTIEIEGLNTIAFEKFSKALLSNDFKTLSSSYKNLKASIQQAKKDSRFKHLNHLFDNIEESLNIFENFEQKEIYQKYLLLSKLMYSKNYYLLSLTYLFEAIRLYVSYSFYNNKIIDKKYWKNSDMYKINSNIISFINQENIDNYKKGYYDNNFPQLYISNKNIFKKIATEYEKLRKLRNNLTHINADESKPNIKKELEDLINNIDNIINTDILKTLKGK